VKMASTDAKNQLLDVAAAELKADKKNLSIRDSMVYVAGSDKGIPLDQIAAKMPGGVIFGRGYMKIPTDVFFHGFAAQFAEVEVDTPQRPCQSYQDRGCSRSRPGHQPSDG
jgi:CO/xanthine dehydrogenase Mo-binding subunit